MSKINVRADHVGSLLRPKRLIDALAKEIGIDPSQFHATDFSIDFAHADQAAIAQITDEFIRDAVARQTSIGLDCVTDGEFRRGFFMGSIDQAVRGFAKSDKRLTFRDADHEADAEARPIVSQRLEVTGTPGADEAPSWRRSPIGR